MYIPTSILLIILALLIGAWVLMNRADKRASDAEHEKANASFAAELKKHEEAVLNAKIDRVTAEGVYEKAKSEFYKKAATLKFPTSGDSSDGGGPKAS